MYWKYCKSHDGTCFQICFHYFYKMFPQGFPRKRNRFVCCNSHRRNRSQSSLFDLCDPFRVKLHGRFRKCARIPLGSPGERARWKNTFIICRAFSLEVLFTFCPVHFAVIISKNIKEGEKREKRAFAIWNERSRDKIQIISDRQQSTGLFSRFKSLHFKIEYVDPKKFDFFPPFCLSSHQLKIKMIFCSAFCLVSATICQ